MRPPKVCLAAMLAALATPAGAQSLSGHPGRWPDRGVVPAAVLAPAAAQPGTDQLVPSPGPSGDVIPVPSVSGPAAADADDNALPSEFLRAARRALAAGRVAEAQDALEHAEVRVLIRAVRPSQAEVPSEQPMVERIAGARAALAAGNRTLVLRLIDDALAAEAADKP